MIRLPSEILRLILVQQHPLVREVCKDFRDVFDEFKYPTECTIRDADDFKKIINPSAIRKITYQNCDYIHLEPLSDWTHQFEIVITRDYRNNIRWLVNNPHKISYSFSNYCDRSLYVIINLSLLRTIRNLKKLTIHHHGIYDNITDYNFDGSIEGLRNGRHALFPIYLWHTYKWNQSPYSSNHVEVYHINCQNYREMLSGALSVYSN